MDNIDFRRRLALHAAALLCAAPLLAHAERITGNGKIARQNRTPGAFTGVQLSISAPVSLRLGGADSVAIEGDDNILPLIETVVEGGVLKIRPVRRGLNWNNANLRITLQARSITSLAVGGSGSIEAQGLRAPALKMDIGGSGSIRLQAPETEALDVSIGGSGNLEANGGSARRVSIGVGGSGDVRLGQTRAVHATVNLAGSGNVQLNVREVLKATIAGSGDIEYYGDPQVSKTVAGSGEVRRLGPLR